MFNQDYFNELNHILLQNNAESLPSTSNNQIEYVSADKFELNRAKKRLKTSKESANLKIAASHLLAQQSFTSINNESEGERSEKFMEFIRAKEKLKTSTAESNLKAAAARLSHINNGFAQTSTRAPETVTQEPVRISEDVFLEMLNSYRTVSPNDRVQYIKKEQINENNKNPPMTQIPTYLLDFDESDPTPSFEKLRHNYEAQEQKGKKRVAHIPNGGTCRKSISSFTNKPSSAKSRKTIEKPRPKPKIKETKSKALHKSSCSEKKSKLIVKELTKQNDEVLKEKYQIVNVSMSLDDVLTSNITYQPVSSIAFARSISPKGITVKCLKGCVFQKTFKSVANMQRVMCDHFSRHHQDDSKWNGFCVKCSMYIHNPETEFDATKFSLYSELDHIIERHIRTK